jgi:hypothetical protein
MRTRGAIALLSVCLLALPAAAESSRVPRNGEGAAIFAALQTANLSCSRYPADSCTLNMRVSTVNRRWASAKIRPTVNGESQVPPQTISLRRVHKKKGRYEVMDPGNGGGCSVPRKPRKDLGLVCLIFNP